MTAVSITDFPIIPASKKYASRRKLVYGVGINDSPYVTQPKVNSKQIKCPFYRKWSGMLERCYSPKLQAKQPTYIGCTVATEWHSFMAFRAWMVEQDWEGMELDKDILLPGNKVYSAERCAFVSQSTNALLNASKASRGALPLGVNLHKQTGKYRALCCDGAGVICSLGLYDIPEDAAAAYWAFKKQVIAQVAQRQTDPAVRDALMALTRVQGKSYG